jgi:uncharacterized protein YkwD
VNRRLPLAAAVTLVACALPMTLPVTAAHAANSESSASESSAVLALVNEERDAAGCAPVTLDPRLAEAAQGHSQDQADQREMTHDGSDGSTVGERVTRAGYRWGGAAENVAAGTTSPERVMTLWMDSADHRANILNCAYLHTGVARVDGWWTQVFARPR